MREGTHMGRDRISSEKITSGKIFHLDQPFLQFVEAMAQALDARDPYTAGHSIRVAEYSFQIARAMGLDSAEVGEIYVAAHLHDIGKIGTPDTVLQKPAKLTAEEFAIVKQHPLIGKRILSRVDGLEQCLNVVELHHENVDGSGYPYGLQGERIPIDARIVRVADAFDAMTSHRAYRRSLPAERALQEIRASAGIHFDADCAEAFLRLARDHKLGRAGRGLDPLKAGDPVVVDLVKLNQAITGLGGLFPQNSNPAA